MVRWNRHIRFLTFAPFLLIIAAMNNEDRIKAVKHHLVDKGMSFREWCAQAGIPRSVARDLVYGRLDGSKSENTRLIKEIIKKEFGNELFD